MNPLRTKIHHKFQELLQDPQQLAALHTGTVKPRLRGTSPAPSTTTRQEDTITQWLGHLKLLEGVPFHYLVAEERLLPVESIRFFCVDSNWVAALIDGAYNIGTTTYTDQAHDQIQLRNVQEKTLHNAHQGRRRKLKLAATNTFTKTPSSTMTGFLLRSTAVTDHPGLEVEGYDAEGNTLAILRMEHLSQDILLCLFAGALAKIKLHDPPEALHSGFDNKADTDTSFTKTLRAMMPDDAEKTGNQLPDVQIKIKNELYRNDKHVIKIKHLADTIQKKLVASKITTAKDAFTAAEFALQMTSGADIAVLESKKTSS